MSASTEPARSARLLWIPESISFPAILAVFTLVTRILCRGQIYFADGPSMLASILDKTYIVQPPGYWLFDRIAGLFHNPAAAMLGMNILSSVAGVVVFYYTACFFASRLNAFLAAMAYSSIFYLWFSGEIHSTYATQIIFPVATYYVLLCYDRDRDKWMLWVAALIFALGTGLRPTDGVFLLPMLLYFAAFRMPRKDALVFFFLTALISLGWLIPTYLAFEHFDEGVKAITGYVAFITTKQSLLTGVRMYTLANPVRYILPMLVAFWPVLGISLMNLVRNWSDWRTKTLILWIVPGSLFFILVLMATAPYLNYLTAAILLLALSVPRASTRKWFVVTAVWNAFVFLVLSPVPSQKLAVNIMNSFVLRCTHGGIEQQYNTILTEMQHVDHAQ